MNEEEYFPTLAASYVRGHAKLCGAPDLPDRLRNVPLEQLTEEDESELMRLGKAAELKIYRFKSTHADLPRVKKFSGFCGASGLKACWTSVAGGACFCFRF